MKAAIVGGGVIGSGWAARFLLNGWDVAVFDPAADAERRLREVLDDARRSLPALYDRALPPEGALAWCPSVAAAVAQADWVQESVPERLPAKHRVLEEIQRHAPRHVPVASSTSGFTPSELQRGAHAPGQILVCGGRSGMRHFIAQFGPALQWNWSRLTDVPELTPELVERIAGQSGRQSGACDLRDLERRRDDNLVAILRALKKNDHGAGSTIALHERGLPSVEAGAGRLPVTVARQVPRNWTDYNGHVNEAHCLELFAQASDRFMELAGADAGYIAGGRSYFTVETHLRHLDEVRAGESIRVTTQILAGAGSKLHLFHRLEHGTGKLAATGEHLLLHVNLQTRRSCPPEPEVAARLARLSARHVGLPSPKGAGRYVGQAIPARDR